MKRRAPEASGSSLAFAGTLVIHGAIGALLFGTGPGEPEVPLQTVAVRLIAAPRPEPDVRRPPPETLRRQAAEPEPAIDPEPRPRNTVAETPPPPPREDVEREPAPRTTPPEELEPDETPSTGNDPTTLEVAGVDFPFPGYIRNIMIQVYRRWNRPTGNQSLQAEVFFFIQRDGSITNFRFVRRSGNFAFDLEAQGAIEAAANAGAFGPLPDGFGNDVLPVSFFFDPRTLNPGGGG